MPASGSAARAVLPRSASATSGSRACWRSDRRQVRLAPAWAASAVVHSSRWRRLTAMRQRARSTASQQASRLQQHRELPRVPPRARTQFAPAPGDRSGARRCRRGGARPASAEQRAGARGRRDQPQRGRRHDAPVGQAACSRPATAARPASGAGCRPSSTGRRVDAVVAARASIRQQLPVAAGPAVHARGGHVGVHGASSISATSLTPPQRAIVPSSRSWLSTVPSGRRPVSTACIACTFSRPLPVKVPSANRSW